MNLAIDIGNTTSKIALFDKNQLVEFNDNVDLNKVISWINKKHIDKAIVSSVKKDNERLLKSVSKHCKIIELDHRTPLPINNLYETPQTMGMDRLAAVVGANHLYRENNCLVIDTGTCITFDFIDKNSNYHGGSISPGLDMKFIALNNFTDNLPLLKKGIKEIEGIAERREHGAERSSPGAMRYAPSAMRKGIKEFELIGKNTHDAIRRGVINGTLAELEGIISAYFSKFDDLTVILCGGDAKFFKTKIKAPIFVVPELVLIGLNRILLNIPT